VGLSVGIVAGAQDGDEQMGRANLSAGRVDDGDGLASIIHEQLLPRLMGETHGGFQSLSPAAVEFAELAIPIPVRVSLTILDPQEAQGDAFLAQLSVDHGPVGTGDGLCAWMCRRGEEKLKEGALIQVCGERPTQPRGLGALQVLTDRAVGDGTTAGVRPIRQPALPLETKDFADLAHG
jgi:hypothetical protein